MKSTVITYLKVISMHTLLYVTVYGYYAVDVIFL